MERKFECWNCKKTFQADDKGAVECPHCHSDNVDYAAFRVPRQVFMLVVAFVLIIIAVIGVKYILPNNDVKNEENTKNEEDTNSSNSLNNEYVKEFDVLIDPSLSVSEIEYNEDDNTYNCSFKVDYPPQQPWKIVIKSRFEEKFIAESNDGKFKHLPYSKEDGSYKVFLVSQSTNESLCEERIFPDFPLQSRVKQPWTAAELEQALKGKDTIVENPHIAPQHTIVIVNKHPKDTDPPATLREVQNLRKMIDGLQLFVEKVEYDDMNRISLAKLRINYPADYWDYDEEDY